MIAGYSFIFSLSTGLTSTNSAVKLDTYFDVAADAEGRFGIAKGLGSMVSRAGNLTLGAYDPISNKWNLKKPLPAQILVRALLQGYTASYLGQMA